MGAFGVDQLRAKGVFLAALSGPNINAGCVADLPRASRTLHLYLTQPADPTLTRTLLHASARAARFSQEPCLC
jgi:hypothetical protein